MYLLDRVLRRLSCEEVFVEDGLNRLAMEMKLPFRLFLQLFGDPAPCWRECSFAKRRHSFQTRADSRLQAYKRSKSAFGALKNTFWPRSMCIPFFLSLIVSLIIAHMFVFRIKNFPNHLPPSLRLEEGILLGKM
jgi:hypothetical protein